MTHEAVSAIGNEMMVLLDSHFRTVQSPQRDTRPVNEAAPKSYQDKTNPANRRAIEHHADVTPVSEGQEQYSPVQEKHRHNTDYALASNELARLPLASANAFWRMDGLIPNCKSEGEYEQSVSPPLIEREKALEIIESPTDQGYSKVEYNGGDEETQTTQQSQVMLLPRTLCSK
jgi:hypothetical protein